MRSVQKTLEILERSVTGMNAHVVGNVVTVVAQGRWKKRQQPQAGDTQVLEIVQLLHQAGKVPEPVVVAVVKRLDVGLVNNRVLIPKRIGDTARLRTITFVCGMGSCALIGSSRSLFPIAPCAGRGTGAPESSRSSSI